MKTRNRMSPSSPTSGLLMRFQNGFQLKSKFLAVVSKQIPSSPPAPIFSPCYFGLSSLPEDAEKGIIQRFPGRESS